MKNSIRSYCGIAAIAVCVNFLGLVIADEHPDSYLGEVLTCKTSPGNKVIWMEATFVFQNQWASAYTEIQGITLDESSTFHSAQLPCEKKFIAPPMREAAQPLFECKKPKDPSAQPYKVILRDADFSGTNSADVYQGSQKLAFLRCE